jgi:hypothetical protein
MRVLRTPRKIVLFTDHRIKTKKIRRINDEEIFAMKIKDEEIELVDED